MPRKNRTKPHTSYSHTGQPTHKKRSATKSQAETAATEQMLLKPDLELYVYKDIDGGWYLTRTKHNRL